MSRFKKILVPIDLELDSAPILEMAGMVAMAFGAQIELAHCFETEGYEGPASMEARDDRDPVLRKEIKHWRTARTMMSLLKDLERRGIAARGRLLFGVAEETLAGLAKKEAFDLIVLGSHSREGLERFISGSVAETLVRIAPCAVLVLPHVGPSFST